MIERTHLRYLLVHVPDCLFRYLLSVLTAHVRKTTPELDVALNIVKDLKSTFASLLCFLASIYWKSSFVVVNVRFVV